MADSSVPSNHARVLLCIGHDPGVRLRDIAARDGVTERTAYGIVTDLTEAGYGSWPGRSKSVLFQAIQPVAPASRLLCRM